ncbi:hypothetical protein K438DRAFT_1419766, partial [Mycena galopus ATCC 62051]
ASYRIPPYFWGETSGMSTPVDLRRPSGHSEARELIGDGSPAALEQLVDEATAIVSELFESILQGGKDNSNNSSTSSATAVVVKLRLSPALEAWRAAEVARGRVLPAKGTGLQRVPSGVVAALGAGAWPAPLLTGSTLFGSGWANMLAGAHDARTLFSNYVVDTGFYLEQGYERAFPAEFERLLHDDGMCDPHALHTPGGCERRAAAGIGLRYIRTKCELEARVVAAAAADHGSSGSDGTTARFASRRAMQTVCVAECSMLGILAEAAARGFDASAAMADMIFSSPGTDVVDVGSDLHNSELCNALLNCGDIAGCGIIDEAALGRVYDAFAHVGATSVGGHRWAEPTAAVTAQLYVWHMLDGRHMFLRRCVLGHAKMREVRRDPRRARGQREADFDEAFDEHFCTTGFSRPLATACDGAEDPSCNRVRHFLALSGPDQDYLAMLWELLVAEPLAYARREVVDPGWEDGFCERLACALAETYARGLVRELAWLTSHANHHAWQVNYLNEAAMWGSFLDDGALKGRLDRFDGDND